MRGLSAASSTSMMAGDYHNGPLSVVIPFGIYGLVGFIWFVAAAFRFLYRNYRFGDPALRQINIFLLAAFTAKIVFFVFLFGALSYEFYMFTGLIGFSVSLNGEAEVASSTVETAEEAVADFSS